MEQKERERKVWYKIDPFIWKLEIWRLTWTGRIIFSCLEIKLAILCLTSFLSFRLGARRLDDEIMWLIAFHSQVSEEPYFLFPNLFWFRLFRFISFFFTPPPLFRFQKMITLKFIKSKRSIKSNFVWSLFEIFFWFWRSLEFF